MHLEQNVEVAMLAQDSAKKGTNLPLHKHIMWQLTPCPHTKMSCHVFKGKMCYVEIVMLKRKTIQKELKTFSEQPVMAIHTLTSY